LYTEQQRDNKDDENGYSECPYPFLYTSEVKGTPRHFLDSLLVEPPSDVDGVEASREDVLDIYVWFFEQKYGH
jgi:hypothetical protein